jgi:predicted dehydrogenase
VEEIFGDEIGWNEVRAKARRPLPINILPTHTTSIMNHLSRRTFLKSTAAAAAASTIGFPALLRSQSPNSEIRVGVVGFNGRGESHIADLLKINGVKITALCDVDSKVLAKGKEVLSKKGLEIKPYTDVRELLASKEIDAISTATPNHWHSLIGVWACQAGKDSYIEKPVSHNVFEGRVLAEAAKKYGRIVQCGTQSRSSVGLQQAVKWAQAGNLGKLLWARSTCYKPRTSIGKVTGPQPWPADIDKDLWFGPAPVKELNRKHLHYDWHWVWDTGCGDLGNQGIHQMDIARWFMGENALSPKVWSVGGRLGYVDDGETPNTMVIVHEYEKAPLIFEVRGLPGKEGVLATGNWGAKEMDKYRGAFDIGVYLQYENGHVEVPSYSAAAGFDKEGKMVARFGSFPAPKGAPDPGKPDNSGQGSHHENWAKGLRDRKPGELNAEILEGHLSSALCHTGNISYRLGKKQAPGEILEKIKANKEAVDSYERMNEHLKKNGVDLEKDKLTLGEFLTMDPKTEKFVGNAEADKLLTRDYRAPYVVPEKA